MTIRVEVKGQTLEFPDGTPDSVIDATVQRDFFGASAPPASVAEKAAARLPQMTKDAATAQADVKNDTIARGVGQALGSAVTSLPVEAARQNEEHPILSGLTGGAYPIAAALLPGMVRSAGHQVAQAGNDVRTAATGNAGPNAPPVTLQQRGVAAARVPVRLLSAALAPFGVAGVADQADALAAADDPNAAIGRTFTNAALTAGAIPASRLVKPALQRAGAGLDAAATGQMADLFKRTPKNSALIDQTAPQLVDNRVSFSSPQDLAQRVGASVSTPGSSGKPTINAAGMRLVSDAQTLAPDMKVPGERPPPPPAFTPFQILKRGAIKAAEKIPIVGPIGKVAIQTGRNLLDSPALNSFDAVQKGRVGDFLQSDVTGDVASVAPPLLQSRNANGIAPQTVQDVLASPAWNSANAPRKSAAADFLMRGDVDGAIKALSAGGQAVVAGSGDSAPAASADPRARYFDDMMRRASATAGAGRR